MGQPKLLLPWGKKTILAHLIEQWQALGAAQIGVVIEPKSPLVIHLDKVDHIINPQPEQGMFSSIQSAARWNDWRAELSHFAVTLGDQPHVGMDTLKRAVDFAAKNPDYVCQPSRNGRPRHPVILPKSIFLELAEAAETNLKQFLQARESQRRLWESDDPALDLDVDTPEDYQRALNIRRADNAAPFS
jgi:molybdenum cofactor cytidylyltransferase